MNRLQLPALHVIGLKIRTSNAEGQAAKDIPALWQQFMTTDVPNNIPNKASSDIYCIYTEYEGDHMKPYTTLLGCPVSSLDEVPEGMIGMSFAKTDYEKFTATGNLQAGAVYNKWLEIWEQTKNRAYAADFEVYNEKAQDPTNAEVDIFISLQTDKS